MSNNAQTKVKHDDDDNECDDDCQFIFPQRLMSILAEERHNEAICWLPHGRAFIIRNRKLFGETIMPKFFPRKSKYSSFTRKLNRW
jgi:HSF-type DNA-binding